MVRKSAKPVETNCASAAEAADVVSTETACVDDEVRVVVVLKVNAGTIGVMSPDCDPCFQIFEGGMEVALRMVPRLVEYAKIKWAESKLNPKCEAELPSQKVKTPVVSPSRASTSRRSTGPQVGQMERLL